MAHQGETRGGEYWTTTKGRRANRAARDVGVPSYPPGSYCRGCGLTTWHWPGCPAGAEPHSYVETDDPADPCTYDVQWFTPEQWAHIPPRDDECEVDTIGRARPYMPDGPVTRLYRHVHQECADNIAAMHAENAATYDPSL